MAKGNLEILWEQLTQTLWRVESAKTFAPVKNAGNVVRLRVQSQKR